MTSSALSLPILPPRRRKLLKARLDALYETYRSDYLYSDPMSLVRRYESPEDREVAAAVTAAFAYGRVDAILNHVGAALDRMDGGPARYVRGFKPAEGRKRFAGFSHRFHKTADLVCLLDFLRQMMERSGTVGGFFAAGYDPDDGTLKGALARFSESALKLDARGAYGARTAPDGAGVRYFFPSPHSGSACKRLCMLARWMVRPDDGVDLGLWTFARTDQLLVPVDTHVGRIASYIGLTRLRSVSWRMADQITESLRRLDPEDPARYDFALSRLGILDRCPRKRDPKKCRACPALDVCGLN